MRSTFVALAVRQLLSQTIFGKVCANDRSFFRSILGALRLRTFALALFDNVPENS